MFIDKRIRGIAVAVVFATGVAQGVFTWTGKASRAWGDTNNWSEGEAPKPSKTAEFVFDSPVTAAFEFADRFDAAGIVVSTNSGQVSIKAPSIRFGANLADDTADGWILEDVTMPGSVVNKSPKALALAGATSLAWNTTFDAAGGGISVSGGIEGGWTLEKRGAFDMVIAGGKTTLDALVLQNGRLAFNGSDVFIRDAQNISKKNYATDFILAEGTSLKTPITSNTFIEVNPRLMMYGRSKTDNSPSVWDASGNNFNVISRGMTLQSGAIISNIATFCTYMIPGNTNVVEQTISGGAKIFCRWFNAANTSNSGHNNTRNMTFTLRGVPNAKPEDQTVLDVGGGQFHLGKRFDGSCNASYNTMLVTDGARVDNASWLCITHEIGGVGNLMRVDKGSRVSCAGIIVGSTGWSNSLEIAGANTKVLAGNGELRVGHFNATWGGPRHNGLRITDGATLQDAGNVYVGYSRSTNAAESDYHNHILVSGGSTFKSKGLTVSHAGPKGGSSNNWFRVEGRGSVWDAGGGGMTCGYSEAGTSTSNQVLFVDGAMITNLAVVSIGYTVNASAIGNRLVVADGTRVFTKDEIRVGSTNSRQTYCRAEHNTITVAGGKSGASVWDMGGAMLSVGVVYGADSPARNNKFILQPDGRVINAGAIIIGRGKGTLTDNMLSLAGGSINGKSLTIASGNGIEALLSSAGLKPIAIEGDVTISAGAYVQPRAAAGVVAGRHLILAWKGAAKDIANLKLHEKTDTRKWKLEIDEPNKRVFLNYTP